MSSFQTLNEKLLKLHFAKKSKLDLSEIKSAYESLNLPYYPKIHIAGTNGKGSCTLKLSSAFSENGYRCGTYTSPHIATFRERIQINGVYISQSEVEKYLPKIFELQRDFPNLTFFEVMTLLAFYYFAEKKVDVAVIETGLGGRLDATNCIQPLLSVITSIGFDHQHILGKTLEKIASEKAGIIKKNIPVVLGPSVIQKSVFDKAQLENAPILKVAEERCNYDLENQHICRKALEYLNSFFAFKNETLQSALKVKPPCRYEKINFHQREVILDVSHNKPGLNRFLDQVQEEYPHKKIILFFSISGLHDARGAVDLFSKVANEIYVLNINHPKLQNPEHLQSLVQKNSMTTKIVSAEQAVEFVLNGDLQSIYLFTGTVFIMQSLRKLIGFNDEEDEYQIFDGASSVVSTSKVPSSAK